MERLPKTLPETVLAYRSPQVKRQIPAAFFMLACLCMLWLPLSAQQDSGPELRPDHPEEYVVQPGDTLWDISQRFLIRPWEWPAIWQANPQVENPHLIFPGDILNLRYLDGRPALMVERRSPRIRELDENDAITAIPLSDLEGFLRYPRMIDADDFEHLPYIVGIEEDKMSAYEGMNFYVRGLEAPVGSEVVVAMTNFVYQDSRREHTRERYLRRSLIPRFAGDVHRPQYRSDSLFVRGLRSLDNKDYPIIGYELFEISRARVLKQQGEVSILQVLSGRREIEVGNYILPIDDYVYDSEFYPRAMDTIPDNAHVLDLFEITPGAVQHNIVMLDIGSNDGVKPGHVFSAFRPGKEIADPVKGRHDSFRRIFGTPSEVNVTIPDELAGQLMVYRSYPQLSYAIVMGGKREIRAGDILKHPDETL